MKYFGKTHVGLRRKENQDSILLIENDNHVLLGMVCDGIGGGRAGDVASSMAAAIMKEHFMKEKGRLFSDMEVMHWLNEAIQDVNDQIFTNAASHERLHGMGTTMVGVLISERATYVFNVGDSRTYGLYGNNFLCLTEDHSYVADLLRRGEVSEEEAKHHPNRNMLTNALGIWDHVKIDIDKIKDNYRSLLICSDGLHGYVNEHLIRSTLESSFDVETKVDLLIQASWDAGGLDNVSVIIIDKEENS